MQLAIDPPVRLRAAVDQLAGVPGCGECRAALDAAMIELAAARAGADSPPSGARADADATDDSDSGAEAGDSDYEYIDGDEVCE